MSQDIHEKIRRIRDFKGFSQDFMAEKLKINQKTYSQWERGEVKLDWKKIEEIASVLEVNPIDLATHDYVFSFKDCSQSGNIKPVYK